MDTIIYQTPLVTVGHFRRKPWEPDFEYSGPTKNFLIVFPRSSVTITHEGYDPVIANPNLVMFYNRGQEYWREKVSEQGDICEWFAYDLDLLIEALQPYDRMAEDRGIKPFVFTHGPSDAKSFFQQRMVVKYLLEERDKDPLFIQESLLQILDSTLEKRYRTRKKRGGGSFFNPLHQALARDTQRFIATHFHEPLTLKEIAEKMSYSQYHLARIFQRHTGYSIHQFIDQIRLRMGLAEVAAGEKDLSALALALGYSSHSHFSQAFKRTFGVPPSKLRHKHFIKKFEPFHAPLR